MDYCIQILLFAVGVYSRFVLHSVSWEMIYVDDTSHVSFATLRGESPPGTLCDTCAVIMTMITTFIGAVFSMLGVIIVIMYMRRVERVIEDQSSTLRKLTNHYDA